MWILLLSSSTLATSSAELTGAPENTPKVLATSTVDTKNLVPSPTSTSNPPTREKFIEQAMVNYESSLIGYASTLLNDVDLARDVVQDTFIRLCRQDIDKVRENLKSWLFTVCRNRALDVLRKDKRKQPIDEAQWENLEATGLQPDEKIEKQERLTRLKRCLERLTDNQREVIILKFQQDLSYQEIQTITGLKKGNIGFLIHTGIKRLQEILPDDLRS
jgi:RNA polymerase sigma-70 factor (ECF subfamily)